MITSPIQLLKTFQREIYDDSSRFVAWLASRQVGKSFTGAGKMVALAELEPKSDVLIAAPSERQSYESVLKCKDWVAAFEMSIADIIEERPSPGALMTSTTIILPNKSRIIAVPGKPDTVRGFCAHLWADEFAFFDDPDATWRAIFPTLSNPIKGLKRALITSTANGKSGRGARFYKMVSDPKIWSIHKTTILDAAPELGTNVEELRAAIDDESAWAQEFMCEFLDSSNCLLPYDIIALAESASASVYADPAIFAKESNAELYIGIDFGRSNDPTVAWTFERVGDVLYTREVLVLRDTSTPDQESALRHRIAKARRVVLDYTGPGIGLGDYLAKEHGEYKPTAHKFGKIELATFTANFKRDIFPKLRRAFEAPTKLRIPIDVDVREDLHEMQQVVKNGEYSYTARRTAEGHSDRCTALALALRAGAMAGGNILIPQTFPTRSAL